MSSRGPGAGGGASRRRGSNSSTKSNEEQCIPAESAVTSPPPRRSLPIQHPIYNHTTITHLFSLDGKAGVKNQLRACRAPPAGGVRCAVPHYKRHPKPHRQYPLLVCCLPSASSPLRNLSIGPCASGQNSASWGRRWLFAAREPLVMPESDILQRMLAHDDMPNPKKPRLVYQRKHQVSLTPTPPQRSVFVILALEFC